MKIKTKFLSLIFPIIFILFGCAGFSNKTVYISEQQIQTRLNEKLVIPLSLLKVFDLSLSNANVKFDHATGRMHTKFDTQLTNQLTGKKMAGKLALSGNLQLDTVSNSVILNDAEVDDFVIDGIEPKYADAMTGLAKMLGSQLLNGLNLYTVKADSLKVGKTQYYPKEMKVTDRGLVVTLTPHQ
jgi:hypothetical protein